MLFYCLAAGECNLAAGHATSGVRCTLIVWPLAHAHFRGRLVCELPGPIQLLIVGRMQDSGLATAQTGYVYAAFGSEIVYNSLSFRRSAFSATIRWSITSCMSPSMKAARL